MVRHRLDSISDCAGKGYDVRISCRRCDHVVEASALDLMREKSLAVVKMPFDKLERRARCKACGSRGAIVTPSEIKF